MSAECEVDWGRHKMFDPSKVWRITAPDDRVLYSCDVHLDTLLYFTGENRVELVAREDMT